MKQYRNRIRDLREDSDLTQDDIAKQLHISQRTYSGYETGYRRAPVDIYIQLAEIYNVDMNYILGISTKKEKFPDGRQQNQRKTGSGFPPSKA